MKLHNTLSGKTETFVPIESGVVKMYHCGPTVYNYAHIGNLRAYVLADTLRRSFEYSGYAVKQVINITDVGEPAGDPNQGPDKIEEGAKREKKSVAEIVDFYSRAFFEDIRKINVNTASTIFPKATEHIKEQIALIKTLESKGFTYVISDGVYFDTARDKEYGKLGNIDLTHIEEGARVAKNPEKRNPTDFALWKFSSEKRQQEWPSPWGVGFPGWHIECSAMSMKYLGETFDIHTGGIDHIPVHHNNEIAQSECATGRPYVHYWLHNAFVNISDASAGMSAGASVKMSKSAENFIRLATLEEKNIHPLAYRYWLLTAHYRSPVNFSFEAVLASQNALESIVRKISLAPNETRQMIERANEIEKTLANCLENDLDTPAAIALLQKTVDEIAAGKVGKKIIEKFDAALGLQLVELAHYTTDVQENIKKLSRERENFRLSNNWAAADALRHEIENLGFNVEDMTSGPFISRPLNKFPV